MRFTGDAWSRAFWDHFGVHLRVVEVRDGRPVHVLRPRSCVACSRMWDVDAPAARELQRDRAYRPRVFTERRTGRNGYWPHADRRHAIAASSAP